MAKTLGITFPEWYREFALGVPNSPDEEAADQWYAFMDVDEIIALNKEFRSGERVEGWKPDLFCIGTFHGGDYFVDLSDPEKGVFLENSNAVRPGKLGSQYDEDDYSPCWVSSLDDLASQ